MNQVTDTNGVALTVLSMSLAANSDSTVLAILVPCISGMWLAADGDPAASVLARRTSSGESFVSLDTSPIPLTPYAGQTISFDVQVHAGAVVGLERVAIPVRVTYQP